MSPPLPGRDDPRLKEFLEAAVTIQSRRYRKTIIRVDLADHEQLSYFYREAFNPEEYDPNKCSWADNKTFKPIDDSLPPPLIINEYLVGVALAGKLASMDFTVVYAGKRRPRSNNVRIDFYISLEDSIKKKTRVNIILARDEQNERVLEVEIVADTSEEKYASLIEQTIKNLIAEMVFSYVELLERCQ